MGSKGIRRRKPYRRLPPAQVPGPDDDVPPHIMWPGPGSAFEASAWSPAGRAQLSWRFIRGLLRRLRRRRPRRR